MRSRSCVKAEDAARGVEGRRDSVHDLGLGTLPGSGIIRATGEMGAAILDVLHSERR
jgi:hypothetical protein